jgi:DNA-binding NtrC family response regulator
MKLAPVLLIDVPELYSEVLEAWLGRRGSETVVMDGSGPTRELWGVYSLCVLGAREEDEASLDRVDAIRESLGGCPVVVIGRGLTVETVVRLMKSGVADVIGLPAIPEKLASRACRHAWTTRNMNGDAGLVGRSPAIERIRREIKAVARANSTVLLTGETGSGKGVVAREIHGLSDRRLRRFVSVDCGALPSSLVESEFFGHERGAFTGAVVRREGRFEQAEGGTILLDEVGDLELPLQAKLLRVLQEREYERVGGTKTRSMTARVIAATNRDLKRAVGEGRFRADLLFRLNVFQIRIPPLRERLSDIPELTKVLLRRLSETLQMSAPELSDASCQRLTSYQWPGNVRELMNLLERLIVENEGEVVDQSALDDFFDQAPILHPAESASQAAPMTERWLRTDVPRGNAVDRERVAEALLAEGGNVSRAARRLGVPRSTLRYWIHRYGL